jgi:hypothetical protein
MRPPGLPGLTALSTEPDAAGLSGSLALALPLVLPLAVYAGPRSVAESPSCAAASRMLLMLLVVR